MNSKYFGLLHLFLLGAYLALAEVTVLKVTQVVYDKSPKIRIRGSGFEAAADSINVELSATSTLTAGKDYIVTPDPDGDGIILKLLSNRKWADLSDRTPPVAMVLSSVTFDSDPSKNLLVEPVIIAQVLRTPDIQPSDQILYMTASNQLVVNGTGFIGAKKVDLYFSPPLVKEVAYEDVTPYPLTKDSLSLRLRHGFQWRDSAGPLSIIGVDTGGGPVAIDGSDGVLIATVTENLPEHFVSAEDHLFDQLVYADDPNLVIKGSGFSEIGNTLRFANGLLGNDVNYTVQSNSPTQLKLRLNPGSFWRGNFDNLPGALTLLAVNAGQGFVAVGPVNSQKGRDIAMIFERPQVYSDTVKIYRTHTHAFHIAGTGFPLFSSGFTPSLKFDPALTEGVDYSIRVVSRTDMEVTLLDGRAWAPNTGSLRVKSIDAGAGSVKLPGDGVIVAEVIEDVAADVTGGVEVFPVGAKVYASALKQDIVMTGTGFKDGISFTFEPALVKDTDYTQIVDSKNKIVLRLKAGKKWSTEEGMIIAKSVNVDGKEYKLANGDGIRVAVVLEDPYIESGSDRFHESQSKLIVVSGSGFTTVTDTKINIRPSSINAYKIIGVLDDAIRIQLKPDNAWLPSFMSLDDEEDPEKKINLQVDSIDTGAGEVVFDTPITIGYVVHDREGVTCDDSCEFAFDGVCDDGSEPFDFYYYENYGNYADDDLGGFYDDGYYGDYEEGEEGEFDDYYGAFYDDYYMENDEYAVSACLAGTDCTDCGGVDAIEDYSVPLDPGSSYESCTNTCIYPRDGVCDDPRGTKYCELGTDCQDCGPVGADNFTRADDDGWWDDDDDYWTFNDGNFLDQTKGLEANRDKIAAYQKSNIDDTPAGIFLVVLEGMVYTVGAIFAAAAIYLFVRWYRGQSVPFVGAFNPEMDTHEFEMAPSKRMPITPDEFRT